MLTGHLYLSCISPSSLHPFLSLSHPSSLLAPTAPTLPLSLRWRRSSRAPPPARRCAPPSPSPPLRSAFALAAAPRHRTRCGTPHPSSPPRPTSALAAAPLHHPCRGAPPPSLPRHPPWCAAARGFRRRQGQPAAGQGGTTTSRRTRSRCARRRGLGKHGLGPRRAAAAASGGARWHNRSRRCSMGTGGEGGVELEDLTLDPFLLSVGVEDGRKGDVDGGGGALGSI